MRVSNAPPNRRNDSATQSTEAPSVESTVTNGRSPSSVFGGLAPFARSQRREPREEIQPEPADSRVVLPTNREFDDAASHRLSPHQSPMSERALLDRGSEHSESRYWTPPTSTRFSEVSTSVAGSDHSVVINTPPESPRETIAAALNRRPFAAEAGLPTDEQAQILAAQREMETLYTDWAAEILRARQAIYKGAGYTLHEGMKTPLKDALLPALYEGISGFISSASRSPVRNAVAAAIGPRADASGKNVGDLAFQLDAASISGAVGGVTAYAVDSWVLQAMSRRKKLSNFPELKTVDPKVLIPDPSPIQLRIVNGAKEYWRPTSADASDNPTLQALKNQVADRREAIAKRQQRLDGKGIFTWSQPAATGAFNVARRAISGAAWLTKPLPVFVGSLLASSSAGALSKFSFGMAKATPGLAQTEIDNLVGGKQRANLYAIKVPHADVCAASWSDIGGLPRFVGDTAREAAALFAHSFSPQRPWQAVKEQALHVLVSAIANAGASITSVGFGSLFGSVERHGSLTPLPNEPPNSKAYLVQQFAQSATNDFYWNGGKEMQKSDAHALGTELDHYRDKKQDALLRAAHRVQATLPNLLDSLRQATREDTDMGRAADVSNLLDEIAAFVDSQQGVALDRFKQAKRQLEAVLPPAIGSSNSAQHQARQNLLDGLDALVRLTGQHEALVRRRQPVGATGGSLDRAR